MKGQKDLYGAICLSSRDQYLPAHMLVTDTYYERFFRELPTYNWQLETKIIHYAHTVLLSSLAYRCCCVFHPLTEGAWTCSYLLESCARV